MDLSNSFEPLQSYQSMETSSPLTQYTPNSCTHSNHKASPLKGKHKKTIKLEGMIINCNGLNSSLCSTEFQVLLELHNPDFVLGTESKLQNDIPSSSIFPSNYTVFRKDRNVHGGGVFQAIKSDLICVEEPHLSTDCEIIWTSLKMRNCKTLYLSTVYRPPDSPIKVLEDIHDSINNVFKKSKGHPNVIIGGDINWHAEVSISSSNSAQQSNKFLHLVRDFSLKQHVQTRTRPQLGKILDLVFSIFPNSMSCVSTVTGISDHLAVIFNVNLKPARSSKPPHKVFMYNRANFDGLNDCIHKASNSFFVSNPDEKSINENWQYFKQALQEGINIYIPQRSSNS